MLRFILIIANILFMLNLGAYASPHKDALFAFYEGDYKRAKEIWQPLAEEGHAKAQYYLGLLYRDGIGIEPDVGKGLMWLALSARQDNINALIELGDMYRYGRYVEPDYKVALYNYRLAIELGGDAALGTLASMFEEGKGTKGVRGIKGIGEAQKNIFLAHIWYILADEIYGMEDDKEGKIRTGEQLSVQQKEKARDLADRCFFSSFVDCDDIW